MENLSKAVFIIAAVAATASVVALTPIPAPFWMLGTALIGMATLKSRQALSTAPISTRR